MKCNSDNAFTNKVFYDSKICNMIDNTSPIVSVLL